MIFIAVSTYEEVQKFTHILVIELQTRDEDLACYTLEIVPIGCLCR